MFRHDARRSGSSLAEVAIDRPTVGFRTYLGGSLAGHQALDLDVDGDGEHEIVYVAGGRVVAKRGDNVAVWESPILPVDTLWATADFDGDGELELVLSRSRPIPAAVVIVRARDGSVAWEMPEGTTDWIGGLSIGDLDGDGNEDLYVGSGMCGSGVTGPPGTAFSFCTGPSACAYASARTLWNLPASAEGGNCGNGGVIGDVTGDGANEIVIPWQHERLPIYSGATGALIGTLPAFDPGDYDRGATLVTLVQLDADPALELVTHGDYYNSGYGSRRVAVYEHDGSAFVQRWEIALADLPRDRMLFDPTGSVTDLDGDGDREIVIGRYDAASGAWSTSVHEALTGAEIATDAGSVLRGVADVDGDGRAEILVERSGAVEAHALAAGALSMRFSIPGRVVVTLDDPDRRGRALARRRVLAMQLDDDPALELVLGESDAAGLVALHAYDTDETPPALLGSLRAPDGVAILLATELGPTTRPHPQPGVATSDGYFLILDRALAVTNRMEGEFPEPGMRIGGYYTGPGGQRAAPIVAAFADGPSILVSDSRGALVRFDASSAAPGSPPVIRDTLFGARSPSVVDLDGAPPRELVVIEGGAVVRRDAAPGLAERWRRGGLFTGGVFNDALPASLPGGLAMIVTGYEANSDWVAVALDGATGAPLWRTPTPRVLGWGVGNNGLHAVGELTGDEFDDVACTVNGVLVSDGRDGSDVRTQPTFMARGGVMLTSVDGDASLEVYAHAGYQPARLWDRAGVVRWTWEPVMALDAFAAEVRCGGEAALVGGAFGSADLWTVRARDGAELAHRSFADGDAFAPGTIPDGARRGSFGNVVGVAAIDRSGNPGVLAGSSDGYLYALDPCTLDRRWSIDLRYPVGEAIAGDLDGDGDDEIVVSVADGHLYGVTHAAYDAPAVRDIAPGAPAVDVDEIDAGDTLHAAWDPVPGATSYVVSVFTARGSEIRFPNARDVGDVTSVAIPMLPLVVGGTYVVAVQAIGPDGPGVEGRSDGVTITDTLGATAAIAVVPDFAWPAGGIEPEVRASCDDPIGVTRIEVDVLTETGAPLRVLEARDATGTNASSVATWDGSLDAGGEAGAGFYVARVRCVDAAGHESTAEASFTLDPSAAPLDAGMRPDAGPGVTPPVSPGCGCAVPRPGAPHAHLALLALALLALRRRRS